jgi:ABC-type nickel/cobalt efflux system permease component RcnA
LVRLASTATAEEGARQLEGEEVLIPLLGLGFLLGIRHALEADHLAAVASLSTRSASLRSTVKIAASWGVGHSAMLVLLGSVLIALEITLPEQLGRMFELAVGGMLIALGVGVLRRVARRRIHLHQHRHGGVSHVHFHAHSAESVDQHEHLHLTRPVSRALLVGGMHGLAGSAALVLIAVPTMNSTLRALGYLVVFAFGSILGMVLFSVALSLPLQLSVRRVHWLSSGLETAVGLVNIALGGWIVGKFF